MSSNTPPEPGQRLSQSRDQLRRALLHADGDHAAAGSSGPHKGAGLNGHGPSSAHASGDPNDSVWTQALQASPALSIVVTAVQTWWSHHPMRASGMVAAEAAGALAKPLAQRHPVALVAGAFGVGALLMWSRPWTWLIKPAVFATLVPPLASSAMARMPIAPWMTVLNALINTTRTATPASADPVAQKAQTAPLH
jgi:hypothetical protein